MHFYQAFLIHWQTTKHKDCFCSLFTLTMTDIFFFIFSGKSFVFFFSHENVCPRFLGILYNEVESISQS